MQLNKVSHFRLAKWLLQYILKKTFGVTLRFGKFHNFVFNHLHLCVGNDLTIVSIMVTTVNSDLVLYECELYICIYIY